jgi:hypothetical protein
MRALGLHAATRASSFETPRYARLLWMRVRRWRAAL